jgi:polar amino acid transport system substrate-binding protein
LPSSLLRCLAAILGLALFGSLPAAAQDGTDTANAPAQLIVATKDAPHFAFVGVGGEWTCIAIDVVEAVAADLGRTVEWREDTPPGIVDAVAAGGAEAAASASIITPAREADLDFTFPY